ncbi:uncharacterized protein phf11 isoform X1 [Sebastes umbrosus]|uniref:uncharacterized protein phf11 isoform X1 n=1 Tax=Sebastes umbrosus TaxID=72105 RepID=UPI00189D1714|nr:uncharacterized protein phf11 isoform X1 [Sebastes umbrosus]
MEDGDKVSCVLCQLSEETKTTGALSTKDEVTAHENCLLFSSGLFCRNTPQFDDLFGFSVEDVLDEVKRGNKLICNKCKKKGATAGCELKRCKRSYHYPCAVQERAKIFEDADQGKFGLYCINHCPDKTHENNGCVNGHPSSSTKPRTSKNPSEAGSSKVFCLACEKVEGNISLESLSNSIAMLYCDKHAPTSQKRNTNGDSTTAGRPSSHGSDSNSSSSATGSSSKKRLSFRDNQEGTPSKQKCKSRNLVVSDDSSDSGKAEPDSEMAIFAPLETDIDDSANSVPEPKLIRKDTERPTGSASGNQLEDENRDGNKDKDDTMIPSDAESESLLLPVSTGLAVPWAAVSTQTAPTLLPECKTEVEVVQRKDEGSSPEQSPVHRPDQHTAGPPVPQQSSDGLPPSPYHSKPCSVSRSPPWTSSAMSSAPLELICVSLQSSPSTPMEPLSEQEPIIDSTSFWKSCNAAGCTQAVFTGFINEMNDISSRIQTDQASQEDYDFALTVLTASGKLTELVAKQQEELQRKQMELQKVTAAMEEVISALRK